MRFGGATTSHNPARRRSLLPLALLPALLAAQAAASCAPAGATPTQPATVEAATCATEAAATPSPLPTRWAPRPTPEPTLEPPPASATTLARQAFASPLGSGAPAGPVLTLINREYEGQDWLRHPLPFLECRSLSEAQALVCIRENREPFGSFSDGVPAYRLHWAVRLLRLSDGQVLAATDLAGAIPPLSKPSGATGYGAAPQSELLAWLAHALRDRTLLQQSAAATPEVSSLAFSPDGKTLAAVSWDGALKLWDLASGEVAYVAAGEIGDPLYVAFSPDGSLLAIAGVHHPVALLSASTGAQVRTLPGTENVGALAFSPDGRVLALGSASEGSITLWDLVADRPAQVLAGHSSWTRDLAFAPDGAILASGSADGSAMLWQVASGRRLRTLAGHQDQVTAVAFSPDGSVLATGSLDRTVRLWAADSGELLYTLAEHSGSVLAVAFSPGGKVLATAGGIGDATVRLWELPSGSVRRMLSGHGFAVTGLAFSPAGGLLATAGQDGLIKLWDSTSWR